MRRLSFLNQEPDESPALPKNRPSERKKLAVVALSVLGFVTFLVFALGGEDDRESVGVRVDPLRPTSGERYGALTARLPGQDEIQVRPPEVTPSLAAAPTQAEAADPAALRHALNTIDGLNDRLAHLQEQLSDAKINLTEKDNEIEALSLQLERLQGSFDQREKKFRSELTRAVTAAEANALSKIGDLQPDALSEEELRKQEEVQKTREKQNRSDGIIYDDYPFGRS
ncbi:hypothetical protein [uncultured Ruegeria sp.]|uniref:hypothetical protein n=1 Tax=uncultured Ruegeria sp. TaxID=259304 RepID=UPI00262C045A|nr:hypothetical protein [uncultured Ruegeria sp.]